MPNFRYTQLIILVSSCILGLLMRACTIEQDSIPTHNQPASPSQIHQTAQSPTMAITFTPTLSPAEQATREIQNSTIATMQAYVATEMAVLPRCGAPLDRSYSSDGNWVAVECVNYGTGVYNLKDFSKAWFFSYYDTFGMKYEHGNHFGALKPKHWSFDGKYLYFSPLFSGDGGCVIYNEGQALLRLDLLSGHLSEILAPTKDSTHYNFSFSNRDTYLGYFEDWREHPTLELNNLTSNTQQEIPLGNKYSAAGYLIWSQDNTNVLFSARSGEECESMIYYLVRMNLSQHSQKIILAGKEAKPYQPIQWIDENHIIVAEWFSEKYYDLNLLTGQVLPYNQPTKTSSP